jgi:integrase
MTALSRGGGRVSLVAVRMLLKGMHWGYRARNDGSRTYYYWAWKNGPQIWKGDQLPVEIPPDHPVVAAYQAAHRAQREKRAVGFVSGLIVDFKESSDFTELADSTRTQWRRWLDRIDDEFGELELAGLDERGFRAEVKRWRDTWRATPRQADYGLQVLVRLLSFAKDRGDIDFNRATGIDRLYTDNQRADLIWTDADIHRVSKAAQTQRERECAFAIRLAALTGLRRGDLVGLLWSQVDAVEIVRPTNKSGGKHVARIPLLPETRILIDEIKQARAGLKVQPATVLATGRGQPWKEMDLTHAVSDVSKALQIHRRLHDLRGTFVTRLVLAGFSDEAIADIVGWSVKVVARLRRTYVSKAAVAADNVRRLGSSRPTGS